MERARGRVGLREGWGLIKGCAAAGREQCDLGLNGRVNVGRVKLRGRGRGRGMSLCKNGLDMQG